MTDTRKAMLDMEVWVSKDRERRETSLAVKTSMRRIVSEFSFQREEGLRELMKLVHRLLAAGTEWGKNPLGDGKAEDVTVSERILRIVFPKTPPPSVLHTMCHTTTTERRLAMMSLEGLCALSRREQQAFVEARGISTVHEELLRYSLAPTEHAGEVAALCACLDALLVACLDAPLAQHQLIELDVPALLCSMLKTKAADVNLRYKIVEFLSVILVVTQLSRSGTTLSIPSFGPHPSSESQHPRRRLLKDLEALVGADILGKLQSCVTLRSHSLPVAAVSPSSSSSTKRTTARERDLRAQSEILNHLAQGSEAKGTNKGGGGGASRPAGGNIPRVGGVGNSGVGGAGGAVNPATVRTGYTGAERPTPSRERRGDIGGGFARR